MKLERPRGAGFALRGRYGPAGAGAAGGSGSTRKGTTAPRFGGLADGAFADDATGEYTGEYVRPDTLPASPKPGSPQ